MAEKTIAETRLEGKDVPPAPALPEYSSAVQELIRRIDPLAARIGECASFVELLDTYIFRQDQEKCGEAYAILPALSLLRYTLSKASEECDISGIEYELMRTGAIPNSIGADFSNSPCFIRYPGQATECPRNRALSTELWCCRNIVKAIIHLFTNGEDQIDGVTRDDVSLSCLEALEAQLYRLSEGFESGQFPEEVPNV